MVRRPGRYRKAMRRCPSAARCRVASAAAEPVSAGYSASQGQASGELMQAPPVLMLEVCQSQFLACASLFVDQPELGEDPHWQASAFALFWSAISGGSHAP